jgi:hypothetical protein
MNWLLKASTLTICLCTALACILDDRAFADTVIGNWESGASEGWIDWGVGQLPILPSLIPGRNAINSIGATVGTKAYQFSIAGGYAQFLSIKLQLGDPPGSNGSNGLNEWRPDFMNNSKLGFDLTLVASEQAADPANNYATIDPIINADGFGFHALTDNYIDSMTPYTGQNLGDGGVLTNNFNPQLLSGTQTTTWVYDISHLHSLFTLNPDTGVPNYIEIVFEMYSNGPVVYHLDNIRLFTPVVAVNGDYNGDGVVDAADYVVWRDHLGQTFALPNRDPSNTGAINQQDYTYWKGRFGAISGAGALSGGSVPEPASWIQCFAAFCGLGLLRRRS